MSAKDTQATLSRLFSGRYEILDPLPWNGLAIVYGARGLMQEELAVAVLPIDCERSPEHSRLFHRTFERVRGLGAGLRVTNLGVQRGVPFVAYVHQDGTTLEQLLVEREALPADEALELVRAIVDALIPLHAQGLHHGDLTPSNVLVKDGKVTLIGLGIAPLLRRLGPDVTGPTGRGSGPEARRYLAPEILMNRLTGDDAPGPHSDVYAVGALLHRLVGGEAPGERPSGEALQRLSAVPALRSVIAEAMAEQPGDRPSSQALRLALEPEALDEDLPVTDPPPSSEAPVVLPRPASLPRESAAASPTPTSKGGGMGIWLGLALVLAIGGGVAFFLTQRRSEPDDADPVATAAPLDDELPEPAAVEGEPVDNPELDDEAREPPSPRGASGPLAGVDDPFLVEELARIEAAGETYEQEDFRRIYGWISRNSSDVRGHLVLGRAYARRGWHRAAVEAYAEALGVDAEAAARDPLILEHLLQAYVHGSESVDAQSWALIRRSWGADALSALPALDAEDLRPELRRKVIELRRRLERL